MPTCFLDELALIGVDPRFIEESLDLGVKLDREFDADTRVFHGNTIVLQEYKWRAQIELCWKTVQASATRLTRRGAPRGRASNTLRARPGYTARTAATGLRGGRVRRGSASVPRVRRRRDSPSNGSRSPRFRDGHTGRRPAHPRTQSQRDSVRIAAATRRPPFVEDGKLLHRFERCPAGLGKEDPLVDDRCDRLGIEQLVDNFLCRFVVEISCRWPPDIPVLRE